VLGRHLAREANVPLQYLPKIMLMLRHAGLVTATRGTKGGYSLLRPAGEIRLGDVVEVFEGPVGRPECLLGVNAECSDARPCSAHAPWKRLRDAYVEFLVGTTIRDLATSARLVPTTSPTGRSESVCRTPRTNSATGRPRRRPETRCVLPGGRGEIL